MLSLVLQNNPRPVNYQFQQNLDYYKTRGADLMNKTRWNKDTVTHCYDSYILITLAFLTDPSRSTSSTKAAPLNINKVSSSLLNFGRKLISPAMSGAYSGISPINCEVHSTSSSSSSTSPASANPPVLQHPLAEPPVQASIQGQAHTQHYRLLKSESMPVHLSKGEKQHTDAQQNCFRFVARLATRPTYIN